jgi:hypothetical protein
MKQVVNSKLKELVASNNEIEKKFTVSKIFKKKVSDMVVSLIAEKLTT